MSYEGSDNQKVLKTVSIFNQNNNNYNVVSDSDSDSNDKNEGILFDENIDDQVEVTPKITFNAKEVCVMKKLQDLYNEDTSRIIKQATKEKMPSKI